MNKVLLSVFLVVVFPVFGQQKDSIPQHKLTEVEVSADARPSTSRSTTPLQIITNKDIEQRGIQTLSDAVRQFNGVVLKDYGGIGGLKTVSIRGMGAEHTSINYDGIAINNVQSGQVDISRFSLDNISFLSLNIGQSDDIFQPARAFASAGTLNLQTIAPRFKNNNYQGFAKIKTGSFGLFNPSVYYAHKLSDTFTLSANGSWQRADGNYPFTQEDDKLIPERKRHNSDINIYNTELNLYSDFGNKGKLQVKAYYFDSERGLPGNVIFGNDYAAERLWDRSFFTQASYYKSFTSKLDFKSQFKYDNSYSRYENTEASGKTTNKYREEELVLSNYARYIISDKFSASLAQDFTYNTLDNELSSFGNNLPYPKRFSSFSALAAQYSTKKLTVTSSLLATYISNKVKNNTPDNYYKKLLPTVSLSYAPIESQDFRIRASYKHGFRVPTFTELFYSSVQKQLNPELAKQTNIGLTWVKCFYSIPINYLYISVDGYYNKVSDKLIIIPTTFIPRTTNLGKVAIKGVDSKISIHIPVNSAINIDMTSTYNYIEALDKVDKTKSTYNSQIPYTPKHSGSFNTIINNPYLNISYTIVFCGKRYSNLQNTKDYRVDGFSDHSISFSREFSLKQNSLLINAGITNISNKNYSVIKYYPMPGRSYNISAKINF